MAVDFIKIKGARANNLKNLSLTIPRNQLVVITGLSGSGKSSLAFDTIYAEGQRRYVESLSSYARQFINLSDRPEVDIIEGLSPAISIDQRTIGNNPRSTVGTITEIYDYLRLLYARAGQPFCPDCGAKLKKIKGQKDSPEAIKGGSGWECSRCSYRRLPLEARDFSFNSSAGACPTCTGLGTELLVEESLVFNPKLSLAQGAIKVLPFNNSNRQQELMNDLSALAGRHGFTLDTEIKDLKDTQRKVLLRGDQYFDGLINYLNERYRSTRSNFVKQELEKAMLSFECCSCKGARLKVEVLAVKFHNYNLADLTNLDLDSFEELLQKWLIAKNGLTAVTKPILEEVLKKIMFLKKVGLGYLSLSRGAATLSGGEAQRLRLATQAGTNLSGVIYILDEPSIGLHERDNQQLIEILKNLRDNGNTVIVVEHDSSMMRAADYLIDIGPGAGEYGGEIIYAGPPAEIVNCQKSLTGDYLSGRKKIQSRGREHLGTGKFLKIVGASEHNLKNIDINLPLGKLVAITGVSGSGKSTLMKDILAKSLSRHFYRAKDNPGKHQKIVGLENIDKVIDIDQSPIGRTPRSNPATYTGIFSYIRDLYANIPEAKTRGLSAGDFSFNVPGGRCETCRGDGVIKVEMQFLADVYLNCDVCGGQRFKAKVLAVKYQGKNIFEVLNLTVKEALLFFRDQSALCHKLKILDEVGLGYIKLGQAATTLSGGEAQRIKLATELSRRSTGKTLYILDEPTTGLHFADIDRLLKVLNLLVEQGNTVLVIEHNLDLIKTCDWLIDLGPEGGKRGGYLVAAGTPTQIAKTKGSYTGECLRKMK